MRSVSRHSLFRFLMFLYFFIISKVNLTASPETASTWEAVLEGWGLRAGRGHQTLIFRGAGEKLNLAVVCFIRQVVHVWERREGLDATSG